MSQLCKESNVSTRTYYKIKKRQAVKDECYWRLFIGTCKRGTREEIVEFWERFGEWFVGVYGEYRDSAMKSFEKKTIDID